MRVLLLLFVTAGTAAAQSPLERMAWLAGCWESRSGDRSVLEMWTTPSGGLMVGASRTTAAGKAVAYEHLRLSVDGEDLVYTAIPSGQRETHFRSTSVSDSGFTVENPGHDFPQRIRYSRSAADELTARVESADPGGRGFDMVFRRTGCRGIE